MNINPNYYKQMQDSNAAMAHHANLGERMAYCERLLGDSADKHAQELQALKDAHNKHGLAQSRAAQELEALKALQH